MILVPSFGSTSPTVGAFIFAKYLKNHGREILFVSLNDNYIFKNYIVKEIVENTIIKEIVEEGIDYECLNTRGWGGLLRNKFRIQDYCQEKAVDVIVTYTLRPTLIASSLTNVVRFAYVRGMLNEQHPLTYGKIISKILLFWETRALRKMDHVFSMTKPMTDWLVSEGIANDKISIINNFVDVKYIHSFAKDARSNKRENMNINIGMLCNLVTRKRVETAIIALSKLVHDYKHSQIRLQIAGSGKLYSNLKQLTKKLNIEENVAFNGFLETPYLFIKKMDLILLTSEAEGVPRCLMEALSLGKTVVASDIPGVNTLIQDKHTGYLFPVGDAEKLAALIDGIIKDKSYLPPERLVNSMLEDYDVNNCCEKMLCTIDQLFHSISGLNKK